MPRNGHLSWSATYAPGYVKAVGYKAGRKVLTERIETTGTATTIRSEVSRMQDVTIVNLTLHDKKGRYVPDACISLTATTSDGLQLLGGGNGDPAFRLQERPLSGQSQLTLPSFNGCLQLLVKGAGTLEVKGESIQGTAIKIEE